MNLLLDTHLLLWAAANRKMMSAQADDLIQDPENTLIFSAASIWEVAIKSGLERADFRADAGALRAGLLASGYVELAITGTHCQHVATLPRIHADPFDRILVAQAHCEGLQLITADRKLAAYPGSVTVV